MPDEQHATWHSHEGLFTEVFDPHILNGSAKLEIAIMRTYSVNWCKIIRNQDGDKLYMLHILRSKQSYICHKKI